MLIDVSSLYIPLRDMLVGLKVVSLAGRRGPALFQQRWQEQNLVSGVEQCDMVVGLKVVSLFQR